MVSKSLPTGIRKRGDGQYQVRIARKGFPEVCETFFSLPEAETFRAKVLTQMAEGRLTVWAKATGQKLGDWMEQYWQEVASKNERSAAHTRSKCNVIKRSFLASLDPVKVTYAEVNRYIKERLLVVGKETVQKEISYISSTYQWAKHEKHWTTVNPAREAKRPSRLASDRRKRRVLTDKRLRMSETDYLVRLSKSPHLALWLELATETSMRRGEIAKLTAGMIVWEHSYIDLRNNKNDEDRLVPLSPIAIELIGKLVSEEDLPDKKVFDCQAKSMTRAFNRTITRARVQYEKDCKERKLEPREDFLIDLHLHDYRHEAISLLFERGDMTSEKVMLVSGHTDPRSLQIYTHVQTKTVVDILKSKPTRKPQTKP